MPGPTLASVRPESRPGVEAHFAGVPGYHLSDAAQGDAGGEHRGGRMAQLGGWLDLGGLIEPADGLGVGFRAVEDVYEPMVRYRRWLGDDRRVALGVVGFGTYATDSEKSAEVRYWRVGGEVDADVRLTPINRWAELHLQTGFGVTGLSASGEYCQDDLTGFAVDCPEPGDPAGSRVSAAVSGAFLTGTVGLSVDLFRGIPVLHSVRLGVLFAGGSMPQVRSGEQVKDTGWYSAGFDLEVGLGTW